MNAVLAFSVAYVLTRPSAASCGDFLSQPCMTAAASTVATGTLFLTVILGLVSYLTVSRRDAADLEPI